LDYQPLVTFEEGLRRTVEWYREAQAKALAKQKSEA
jgi:dTDP-D-glucose 4,6-dehydratase